MSNPDEVMRERLENEIRALDSEAPSWRDDVPVIREYAKEVGFSDGELNTLYDHRAVIALREAALAQKERQAAESGAREKAEFTKTRTVRAAGAYLNKYLKW